MCFFEFYCDGLHCSAIKKGQDIHLKRWRIYQEHFRLFPVEAPETDDSIFAEFLTSELGKITSDDIKRHVKRKLTDIMFDAVEEDAQRQQQQQQPQEVQYVMFGDTSTLQFLHVSEP